MAKKLLAVLIAVLMVVPMILVPTSADTFTYNAAIRFDAEAGHGYSNLNGEANYPAKAYHLMERVVIDWTDAGAEATHGSISWVNGNPNTAYGFDFYTGKVFVANAGWDGKVSDGTTFLAQEDFALEDGEYYQFDWYVSATEIKGYVNGELVIDYVGSGLWNPGGYIISYPVECKYDILDIAVTAQDGSATYCANATGWYWAGPMWTDASGGYSIAVQDYTVERYEIVDWTPYAEAIDAKIDAIGNVGYNEWVSYTDTNCMSYEAANNWGPYDDVQASIGSPYRLEMDVQIVENKSGTSIIGGDAQNGGGAYLGYNIDAGKFFIAPGVGSTAPDFENVYASAVATSEGTTTLDPSKVYTIGLVFASDYVAVEFQGSEVVRSNAYSFVSGDFHLGCPNVKFNIFGYRVYQLASGVVLQEDNWGAHSANATLVRNISCTADKFVNSGAVIAAAREAYDAANAQTKALVTKYQALLDAEALYNQKVAAVAQSEANEVIALIDAIGTVTVDSIDAIVAAERAYAGIAPAAQALVTNYATLTAARAAYDTMTANIANYNAAVAALSPVAYQPMVNNYQARETDYDAYGLQGNFDTTNGYENQKYNGTTELSCDYRMEFDFQVVSADTSTNNSQLSVGTPHYNIGYDFPTQSFTVNEGSSWTNLDPENDCGIGATQMTIIAGAVYHWKMEVKGNRISLFIDDVLVAEKNGGTAENPIRVDKDWCIMYPTNCVVNLTNYTWTVNAGAGWTVVEGPLFGQDFINSTTFAGRGTGYGNTLVAIHADAVMDYGDELSAIAAAYADLTAYEKSQVAAAKAVYDAKLAEYNANAPQHVHNYAAVVTAPTCTEQGYTTYTCSCGDSYVADYVPATGHSYGEWTVTTPATCTEAGVETRVCANDANHTETRPIAATGHNFVNGVCTVCGEPDPDYVPVVSGDANGDGEVTSKDLTLLRRYIANYNDETETSTVEVAAGADLTGDGVVSSKDLTALRRMLAAME